MILTFKELGIDARDYNGLSYVQAHALIVNQACDYIRMSHDAKGLTDEEFFPNIKNSFTNFILGTVYVPTIWDKAPCTVSMDGWTNPNTLH